MERLKRISLEEFAENVINIKELAMNVVVNVYGNYRKLSEVEYLRLTC